MKTEPGLFCGLHFFHLSHQNTAQLVLAIIGLLVIGGCGNGEEPKASGCILVFGPDCPPPPPLPPTQPDTTPPQIKTLSPNSKATWVSRHTSIGILSDDRLNPASINDSTFFLRDQTGQVVSSTISYLDTSRCFRDAGCGYTAELRPSSLLSFGTTYTVTVTSGIQNRSGFSSPNSLVWSFTTLPLGSGTWQPTPTAGTPSGRYSHTAVWTGSEMIIWGGLDGVNNLETGGRYDPITSTWQATSTMGAPLPRHNHTVVWTGTEMIVWGGRGPGPDLNTGGRYDPITDSWRDVSSIGVPPNFSFREAVWTGTEMIVWGPPGGALYDPISDTWRPISATGAPPLHSGFTAIWTGTEMIVWGGRTSSGGSTSINNVGASYDPLTDTWRPVSMSGTPAPRESHIAVWTGNRMIVWGGWDNGPLNSGGSYDPITDTWEAVTISGAPPGRSSHTAIWTATEMIIWGGSGLTSITTGGRYQPITNVWEPTSNIGMPIARDRNTAVWTGTEMIIWGGRLGGPNGTNTGGSYLP